MTQHPVEVLLVDEDPELAEMLADCLREVSGVRLSHVGTASAALCEELTTRHEIVIASLDLPDAGGLELIRELRVSNRGTILLIAESPTAEEVIQAMRLGVRDVLCRPFDLAESCELIRAAAQRALVRRHQQRRYRRLRRLSSRIVRERRDLRQRIDLVCRDFVQAYRRLAQRVSESNLLPRA